MLLWVFVLGVGAKINYKIRCCKQPAWPPLDTSTNPSRLFWVQPSPQVNATLHTSL